MLIQTSDFVIIILSVIILALLIVVVKLNIDFYKEKKTSKKKIKDLDKNLVQISKNQSRQLNKIKLSETLKIKIKTFNTTMGLEIFELNKDLFELLSKNNLT